MTITNTARYRNHGPKRSIMWLRTGGRAIRCGDRVCLFLTGKTNSAARFVFGGDGGYLDPNVRANWAESWKRKVLEVKSTPVCTTWLTETIVDPTQPGYEPGEVGASMWLMSSVGTGTAQFKKIKVVKAPALPASA